MKETLSELSLLSATSVIRHSRLQSHGNLETVPRLYKAARPGSDFEWSLDLLERFKQRVPGVPTKSGLMLGLGETDEEVIEVMKRMREHDIDMLTLGQYLQPSRDHMPVQRFVHPDVFAWFAEEGLKMGFKNVASGFEITSD